MSIIVIQKSKILQNWEAPQCNIQSINAEIRFIYYFYLLYYFPHCLPNIWYPIQNVYFQIYT